MRIFLAAPLFCESELEFNSEIASRLRSAGFDVWLAQESSSYKKGPAHEKDKIFKKDISALRVSDLVVAVLDGVDVDTGVAFELGYACASGKTLVGLKTDYRTFSKTEEVNLMIEVPLSKLCRSVDGLIEYLKTEENAVKKPKP